MQVGSVRDVRLASRVTLRGACSCNRNWEAAHFLLSLFSSCYIDTQLLLCVRLVEKSLVHFAFPFFLPYPARHQVNMLRNGASRLALKSIAAPTAARPAANFTRTAPSLQRTTQFGSLAARRPQLAQAANALKPSSSAILRRSMADGKLTDAQKQAESRYAQEEIKPTPETVTSSSSTHPMFSEVGAEAPANEVDMMAGVKHDVVCIRQRIPLTCRSA